ncbi:MAG: hypothetical protein H6582_12310 [Crocinitomicaceae bacterium]|nr:hypothetical protein [Crocinitomicaceae bacterium]
MKFVQFHKSPISYILLLCLFNQSVVQAQDSLPVKLNLNVPLIDLPQNVSLPQNYPSMKQSVEWSTDLYELGFWGIDALGNKIFNKKVGPTPKWRSISNKFFKYGVGLGFSYYGSELPIPLGVWAHEEFHRTTLGVANISSKNGNWLFHRWDGTVYGVSDESLTELKQNNIDQLLYSYVAGVQYEVCSNQKITIEDSYADRVFYKNPLLLYNAYYVFNYFRFSTSSFSDTVKIVAPQFEDPDPKLRDYAGADLTAWAFDMYNPEVPYGIRDSFPNGEGINRRVGFSDLSNDAQQYLRKQKDLSLLNFINPAIFMVNKIRINPDISFNVFAQYAPTHFGNAISGYLPFKYKKYDLLLGVNTFNNSQTTGLGLEMGLYNFELSEKISMNSQFQIWNQPTDFWSNSTRVGGSISTKFNYCIFDHFQLSLDLSYKSRGWQMANPYLSNNASIAFGLNYRLMQKK